MKLAIPELALVVLVGASGCGKSTFARQHFRPTEVLSSDFCRALVADDENDQSATQAAFEVLHFIAGRRLAAGRLTVVDATNVQPESRRSLVALARQYHCLPVAIVLDLPAGLCWQRTRQRTDRSLGRPVIERQVQQLHRSLRGLKHEGFNQVYHLDSPEAVAAAGVERQRMWTDLRHEHGPFDLIGDVHGCCDELEALLLELGYRPASDPPGGSYRHPEGRRAVFLGDLVDRGPRILDTYRLVRGMVDAGQALCVPGNHDQRLVRALRARGRDVPPTHGLAATLAEIDALPAAERDSFARDVADFFDRLVSHYVLDDGRLVAAHAGLKAEMQGRGSAQVREFALYGETTGETDEFGLPVRANWAADYRGGALVVYGHTPVPEPYRLNRTVNVDTGCVFGGRLTALRYPEDELISVAAARAYTPPARPLTPGPAPAGEQQPAAGVLRLEDVAGKRQVDTRLRGHVTVREENAIAALEVMSRFAVDPRWLIYLPPTMSPSETSREPGLLEHPAEALGYYRRQGIDSVVCEQKHMGSRAVVVVCRDEEVARRRFGLAAGCGAGTCYTRTGRRFFDDPALEAAFLDRVRSAAGRAGWWEQLNTDWLCLDAELMPWSAKAQGLLREQYAATGAAARVGLAAAVEVLARAAATVPELAPLLERTRERQEAAGRYAGAYRHYCWPVTSLDDLRLAPFHLLASEGTVHTDRDHVWHMDTLAALCRAGEPLLEATPYRRVDLADAASCREVVEWWEALTGAGGEGMVVKPHDMVARGKRGLVQPAIKCRGREYLRLIYGPEYTLPEHLERLRARGLAAKRSLALREFALGVEALERFVRAEPLYRVHECVFGVLALESEPVDPRL